MAATLVEDPVTPLVETANGPRQVSIHNDVGQIADLIELAFAATMDDAGRSAVREMRMLSKSAPIIALFNGLNQILDQLESGFVWVEDKQIVGNVSISPAPSFPNMGRGFVIANVATHPDFRRRGIANLLMQKSLQLIRDRGGKFAILQVDATNENAQALYQRLGFRHERTFGRWHRPAHLRPPARLPNMPEITQRARGDWRFEYALAQLLRPNHHGGLGWLRPTVESAFRPSFWQAIDLMTQGRHADRWIVRDTRPNSLAGVLRIEANFGGPERLDLLVNPYYKGQLEEPLLNFALRVIESRYHAVAIEHPLDDVPTVQALERYDFDRRYTLMHMRVDLD